MAVKISAQCYFNRCFPSILDLRDNEDPWQEALASARALHRRALLIDTENPSSPVRRVSELAAALNAPMINLDDVKNLDLFEMSQFLAKKQGQRV
jgi:Mg-chelatase subunit ChlD